MVDVRFEHVLQIHSFDCGELLVRPGDKLIVQTPKGPQIAKAVSVSERRLVERELVQRVIRRANERDVEVAAQLVDEGRNAMRFALKRVRAQKLPMKLVVVEYMLDRSRALVYFTSESRVDFRNLVRELATELRVRIEMRQIGVRDGTGVIGGIGPCGHELCCSAFLRDFQTVSIREPKEQGITLNPQRITGMCGRLKCCLLYEKQSYTAVRPFTPRQDRSVLTAQGPGSIMEIDALRRKIQVRFPGGTMESIHMRDLIVLDVRLSHEELQATMTREEEVLARRRQKSAGGRVAGLNFDSGDDGYLWDDVEQPVTFFDSAPTKEDGPAERTENKRSKNRRRGGKPSAEGATESASSKRSKSSARRVVKRSRKTVEAKQTRNEDGQTTLEITQRKERVVIQVEESGKIERKENTPATRRRRRRPRKPAATEKSADTQQQSATAAAGSPQEAAKKSRRRRRPRRPDAAAPKKKEPSDRGE